MSRTDDIFAAMTAEDFGLPVRMPPAHWLKPGEGDETAKGINRLQTENARLTSAQPMPRFVDEHNQPLNRLDATIKRYPPVPDRDRPAAEAGPDRSADGRTQPCCGCRTRSGTGRIGDGTVASRHGDVRGDEGPCPARHAIRHRRPCEGLWGVA